MTRTARRPPALGPRFLMLWALWAGLMWFGLCAVPVHAEEGVYTPSDTLQAIEEASTEIGVSAAYLRSIIACETGNTFSNYLVGKQGELGAVQLAPWGELKRFYAWGYIDPHSPYQSVRFLAQRVVQGGASAWSCA